MAGKVEGLSVFSGEYARLGEGGPYPIVVTYGDKVKAYRAKFNYQGPAQTLYVCWGLKKGTDFINGQALLGGVFASASVQVPLCLNLTPQNFQINAILEILAGWPESNYTTFTWISTTNTANESDALGGIQHDDNTVRIIAPQVTGIGLAYVKV